MHKVNGVKMKKCNKIKARTESGWCQKTWKNYFDDLYNIDRDGCVTINMYSSDGIRKGNYFGEKLVKRNEVEMSEIWS